LKGKAHLNMSAKGYPIIELFDFSYFGRFYLMPKNLGNVYIALNHTVNKRSEIVLKLLSPPAFIFNF